MIIKKKINNNTVLVSYGLPEILIRKSGKTNYDKEEELFTIKDNKIVINAETVKKHNLEIAIKN